MTPRKRPKRLTPDQKRAAQRRYAAGDRVRDIARDFGVSVYAVYRAKLPHRGPPTHCPHGHPRTAANTFVRVRMLRAGGLVYGPYVLRECRTCRAMVEAAGYYSGRRAKRLRKKKLKYLNLTAEQAARSAEMARRRLWE